MMKVMRCKYDTPPFLTKGKNYNVTDKAKDYYDLTDDTGGTISVHKSLFEEPRLQRLSCSIDESNEYNQTQKKDQIGGSHYNKNDPIQFARDNYPKEQLEGFFRINVDKYVARYDKKNGLEDLKKAKHYLDMLIELKEIEYAK